MYDPADVYKVFFGGEGGAEHHALFLVFGDYTVGNLYQVVGSVQEGFRLSISSNYDAFSDQRLLRKIKLGRVYDTDKFVTVVKAVQPPRAQAQGNPPYENCQTWVSDVLEQLQLFRVLV